MPKPFKPKGRRVYVVKIVGGEGEWEAISTGTRDRTMAEAMAGLVSFLREANPELLVPVIERRVALGVLFDTLRSVVTTRETVRAIDSEGEGSTPDSVRRAIREAAKRDAAGYVYAIRNPASHAIKIGFATDPRKRFSSLGVAHSERLELLGVVPGDRQLESELATAFGNYRIRGEWFRPHRDVLAWVKEYCTDA
jgi:hypothetical protein